jgi:hypothetical protein
VPTVYVRGGAGGGGGMKSSQVPGGVEAPRQGDAMLREGIDARLDRGADLAVLGHGRAPGGGRRVEGLVEELGGALLGGQPRQEEVCRVAEALEQSRVVGAEGEGRRELEGVDHRPGHDVEHHARVRDVVGPVLAAQQVARLDLIGGEILLLLEGDPVGGADVLQEGVLLALLGRVLLLRIQGAVLLAGVALHADGWRRGQVAVTCPHRHRCVKTSF